MANRPRSTAHRLTRRPGVRMIHRPAPRCRLAGVKRARRSEARVVPSHDTLTRACPIPPTPKRTQVVIPSDLHAMDLTLSSARVKLKRVYVSQPMEVTLPPPPAATAAGDADGAAAAAAGAKRVRTRRKAAAAPATATVTLKVSVAAVVDNLGGKRLEVRRELAMQLRESTVVACCRAGICD